MALWTPANLVTAPRYIFDPTTFTYSGANFASGTNGGSVGGPWTVEAGTPAKGTQLNGIDVIGFTGAQVFLNTVVPWPANSNVFVFSVIKVPATVGGSLTSHSWGVFDHRDATHGWVYYPRVGSGAFGGGVNEGGLFQGIGSPLITRGDVFTDASYHIVGIKIGTTAGVMRKDGTVATTTQATTGTINSQVLSNNCRVGASDTGSEFLTGDVAYVAILVDPTLDEIQKLEGWAAWKYNLVAQLDASHPFKSVAPDDGTGGAGLTIGTSSLRTADGVWTFSNILGVGGNLVLLNGLGANAKNFFANKMQISGTGKLFAFNSFTQLWSRWDGTVIGWTLNSPPPPNPPPALWDQIVADNGLLSTRPIDPATGYRHPLNGIYPFGLPIGFSWYYGGPNYLGDLSQQCPAGWTAYTVWYVVYCEAVAAGGAAKPSVPCNVITRNCKAWAHTNSNTWVQIQGLPGQLMLSGRSDGAQTGNAGFALNPVANPDGTFTEQAPPNDIGSGTGWANHGFPNSRGVFTANSIDGVYGTFEMRVDQPNANKLAASGSDWWLNANAPFPQNTGYSQSAWIRLDTNFRLFSATNLSTTTLQSNPPPPLVGLI